MKITKKRRKGIEELWIKKSENISEGKPLCNFTRRYANELADTWSGIWLTQRKHVVSRYYGSTIFKTDCKNLTYLCRALSLNILLDDNEG